MADWIEQIVGRLAGSPWLQGIVAAFGTLILEDPTTITCGLLVAEGRMLFLTALVGLSLGIAIGDLGLYAIGRLVGPNTVKWGLITVDRLERARHWFDRNLLLAVLISRFLPGTRLPTYVGAGIFQASAVRFLAAALVASLVWTFVLLTATVKLGEAFLPMLGRYRWPIALTLIAAIVLVQRRAAKRFSEETPESEPVVSMFEFWPPVVFYFPVGIYYAWLALRYRSFTLPTAANPTIYSGGLIRESKSQILSLVPDEHRRWIAPFVYFEKPASHSPPELLTEEATIAIERAGISFPFVAKPDAGQRGAGVQRIYSKEQLQTYLEQFPAGSGIMFQELADLPHEAGVMYFRYPGEAEGRIISITLKEFPRVVGDGRRTLRDLILADPRARIVPHVYLRRHAARLDEVIPAGEPFPLVFAGNHAQGAVFKDGTHLATPALLRRLHEIAVSMPEFYFGRFDIRYTNTDAFFRGEDLRIIEINGAGAEATHIWDAKTTLLTAYRTLFRQFRILFEIGAMNRRRGFRALGPVQLLRDCRWYRAQSRRYPATH